MHLFEKSLVTFKESIQDCFYMCEDVINVNLTQPNMNEIKKKLLEEYSFKTDTMEFYELLIVSIKEVCVCVCVCVCARMYVGTENAVTIVSLIKFILGMIGEAAFKRLAL